ncbi:hypothetical protein [Streptomyces noursei]|uniref:hypothetical protein n=1 Tax=Streptomyces noursei TaxID=1971 RepID=UPI0023B82E61|nr:hypothetical protein [Streptomyces noursei]
MSRSIVDPSLPLPDRAAAVLGAYFPQHLTGERDGWRILTRNDRWAAVWDLGEREDIETPERAAKRLELARALATAGYAVTQPSDLYMVFFADRPHDTDGPRYVVVPEDTAPGGPCGGSHVVMDNWTRIHVSTHQAGEEAQEQAEQANRDQVRADAGKAVTEQIAVRLEEADAMLGAGNWFFRQELRALARYSAPVRHERIDALVAVAGALASGRAIERAGRLVAYGENGVTVRWVAKSEAPSVGFFPAEPMSPIARAAFDVLTAARLTPAVWGERISGEDAPSAHFFPEQDGFAVGDGTRTGDWGRALIDCIGKDDVEHQRVPEVLRAAGWTVADSTGAWAEFGVWEAMPPGEEAAPGLLVEARVLLLAAGVSQGGPHRMGFKLSLSQGPDEVMIRAFEGGTFVHCPYDGQEETIRRRREAGALVASASDALVAQGWTLLRTSDLCGVRYDLVRAPQPEHPTRDAHLVAAEAAAVLVEGGYRASGGPDEDGFTVTPAGWGRVRIGHQEVTHWYRMMLPEHYSRALRAAGWRLNPMEESGGAGTDSRRTGWYLAEPPAEEHRAVWARVREMRQAVRKLWPLVQGRSYPGWELSVYPTGPDGGSLDVTAFYGGDAVTSRDVLARVLKHAGYLAVPGDRGYVVSGKAPGFGCLPEHMGNAATVEAVQVLLARRRQPVLFHADGSRAAKPWHDGRVSYDGGFVIAPADRGELRVEFVPVIAVTGAVMEWPREATEVMKYAADFAAAGWGVRLGGLTDEVTLHVRPSPAG